MRPRVLIVAGDFSPGGGQIFAARLANALAPSADVLVLNADFAPTDDRLRGRIGPGVRVVDDLRSPDELRTFLRTERVDVVNSHLWQADTVVLSAVEAADVRWVVSMHGCYEMLLAASDAGGEFRRTAGRVLNRANAVVVAADKNMRVFQRFALPTGHVRRIPYGYEPVHPARPQRPHVDVVFGVASRAVPRKGWEQALFAFERVRRELLERGRTSALVLVGGGPLVPILRALQHRDVHLTDWVPDPENWIAGFDIAMLPTSYVGESYPNAVIEYLSQSKPVIATRWAEIPAMLESRVGRAGALVGFDAHGGADVDQLAAAMLEGSTNPAVLAAWCQAARERRDAFSMERCAASYRAALGW